ncbi:MAG: arsenate reductase (glutaredoxin) [Alphaproteobacteria bacterium]|nr:MAG: arsenate reductase (glutaredoxin) [Alphaproteobacteria bacterium]
MDVIIYHNPACGTSRNTLALLRHVGVEPRVVEYLKTPPSRGELQALADQVAGGVRALLRQKGTPYAELGLDDRALTDVQLLNALHANPILLNRPVVTSSVGTKVCRPSERVLDLLPSEGLKPFAKEDGEVVIDADGRRVRP